MRIAIAIWAVVVIASANKDPDPNAVSGFQKLMQLEENYRKKINETLDLVWTYQSNISKESEWAEIQANGIDVSDCLKNYEHRMATIKIAFFRLKCSVIAAKIISQYTTTIEEFFQSNLPDRSAIVEKTFRRCIDVKSPAELTNCTLSEKESAANSWSRLKKDTKFELTHVDEFLENVYDNLKSCYDQLGPKTLNVRPIVEETNTCVERRIEHYRNAQYHRKKKLINKNR